MTFSNIFQRLSNICCLVFALKKKFLSQTSSNSQITTPGCIQDFEKIGTYWIMSQPVDQDYTNSFIMVKKCFHHNIPNMYSKPSLNCHWDNSKTWRLSEAGCLNKFSMRLLWHDKKYSDLIANHRCDIFLRTTQRT